jgi:ribosomal RNA-processing protein 12
LCLRDSLSRFQETSALASASEGIEKIFERSLLLAGGSKTNATEGSKGAQEVLYVLDALKECLPLMSMKYRTSVLNHFKTLMELHQPLVTRRITDSLYFLLLVPDVNVSPEALRDLISSIALTVSTNETSADAMTFAARLLDVGMSKMYSLSRELCVTMLPVVFNALKGLFFSFQDVIMFTFLGLENLSPS